MQGSSSRPIAAPRSSCFFPAWTTWQIKLVPTTPIRSNKLSTVRLSASDKLQRPIYPCTSRARIDRISLASNRPTLVPAWADLSSKQSDIQLNGLHQSCPSTLRTHCRKSQCWAGHFDTFAGYDTAHGIREKCSIRLPKRSSPNSSCDRRTDHGLSTRNRRRLRQSFRRLWLLKRGSRILRHSTRMIRFRYCSGVHLMTSRRPSSAWKVATK